MSLFYGNPRSPGIFHCTELDSRQLNSLGGIESQNTIGTGAINFINFFALMYQKIHTES